MDNEHQAEGCERLFDPSISVSYREAIPTKLDIVDVLEMDNTKFDFANQWITAVLGKRPINIPFRPDIGANKVAHLFFTARNTEKIKGYKNLGFGYPILAKKDGLASSGLLAAPIFIWDIQLEPDALKEDIWQVSLQNPISVKLNPILADLSQEVKKLTAQYEKRIAKRGVDLKECTSFCESLAELLNYQNDRPNYSVEKFPDIVDLATIQAAGAVVWSGVFAAFPPIHIYANNDPILSKDYWSGNTLEQAKDNFQFCYLPCDHQQKAVHLAANKYKFVLVEGAAGSGKNHTIANLLIDNLINGKRSLVVGKSVVELEKLATKLENEGFGELVFLFRNTKLDKDNLVDNLMAKSTKSLKTKDLDNDFPLTYKRFNKFRGQLENAAAAYGKNVFDINNWTETVGLFLKNSHSDGKELLDTQLQVNEFSFDFLEYEQLKDKIEASEKLFKEPFSFHHPLDDLNDAHFVKEEIRQAKNDLINQLNKYLKKTRKVQRDYLQKVGLYKNSLEEFYEGHSHKLSNQIKTIRDLIDQLQVQFGKEYDKTSVGNLKILKNFSGKSKTALTLKNKILQQFDKLKKLHFKDPFFDFEFLESIYSGNIPLLENQLNTYGQALNDWRIRNLSAIQDNVKNLNSKTVLSRIPHANKIAKLELTVDALVEEINESQLFKIPFKNHAMTLHHKQQLLDEIIEKLNSSLHNLRDFNSFFEWRKLMSSCSLMEEKVITSLIKVRPERWLDTFDAWYFHNLLTKQSRQNANFEPLLNTFLSHYNSLVKKAPSYITDLWQKESFNTITATKKKGKSTFNSFLKKSTNQPGFAKYFQQHLHRISGFYPIFLMTTEMAKELMPTTVKEKFDALIIKDGGQLTKEQNGNLLDLAHTVQVFSSGNERIAAQTNSFLHLARKLAGKQIFLKMQHREKAIPLLAFNNAAFNQHLEVSMNGKVDKESIQIFAVNGAYDENLKVNEKECRYMLSMLTGIEGTPQHTYPKVGFACATIEQRNLFSSYILKIKQNQSNGVDKIHHLERNGMGVFSFEELAGQQFDILIISLAHGPANATGEMTKEVSFWSTTEGENQLHKVLNSSIQKVKVCHSFSPQFIRQHQGEKIKNGLSILANFLAYGVAIKAGNASALHKIVNNLSEKVVSPKTGNTTVFLNEVAHYLSAYFEPDRILTNHIIKNQIYPLVIKGKTAAQPNYVIQADSFFTNVDVFSFVWQNQANRAMESVGYKFLTIWSRDWWRHPEEEARKLASKIIREDTVFVEEKVITPFKKI